MCVATRLCVGHSGIGLSLSTHINILVFAVIYPSQIIRKKKMRGKLSSFMIGQYWLQQSKVKQVVGVLKPQFTSESNISAIGAIGELEGFAAMDFSTPLPFKEDAQLLPAAPPAPQNGVQLH